MKEKIMNNDKILWAKLFCLFVVLKCCLRCYSLKNHPIP